MATLARRRIRKTVLRDVSYKTYVKLVRKPSNYHLRMTYYDGTLEIMSPQMIHEVPSRRLGMIVLAVTSELDIPCSGTGSTTFRRAGEGVFQGKGKEPDQSFYVTNVQFLMGANKIDLDAGDPPPDLWIEVDNRASSLGKLPVYAALGVPEVWRHRASKKTLAFLRLTERGAYEPVERSVVLPMLTPALVLEAIALGEGIAESFWDHRLRRWVRETLRP